MSLLTIITPSHPILRRKARPIAEPRAPEIQRLIDDMVETMRDAPGVGLAAPQVAEPVRLVVIEYAPNSEDLPEDVEPPAPRLYVVINPEIT